MTVKYTSRAVYQRSKWPLCDRDKCDRFNQNTEKRVREHETNQFSNKEAQTLQFPPSTPTFPSTFWRTIELISPSAAHTSGETTQHSRVWNTTRANCDSATKCCVSPLFLQGGLICRAFLSTTPDHNVHTFISLSSPQAGQYGGQSAHTEFFFWCISPKWHKKRRTQSKRRNFDNFSGLNKGD